MRPNIDISWSVHGDVKEYSERTGKTIEEAYVDVIKRGLRTTSDRSRSFTTEEPTDPVFSPINEKLGVGNVVLFSDFDPSVYEDKTVVHVSEKNLSTDQAEGILADLYHRFMLDRGSYSIQQKNAGWYGDGGVDGFFYWLENLDELYSQCPDSFKVQKHRNASAAFIGSAPYPANHVIVYATANNLGEISRFGVDFIIDGYPLEGGEFKNFADTVGVNLSHLETWSITDHSVNDLVRVDIDEDGPIKPIRNLTRESQEEVIEGVLCENPFYSNEEASEREFDNTECQQVAQGVELIPGRLKHTVEKHMEYDLFTTKFKFSNLDNLTRIPASLINVDLEVNW